MTGPTHWRKKPVVIEAMQWDGTFDSAAAIAAWSGATYGAYGDLGADTLTAALRIETSEGSMNVSPDDWVIRGVKGEFYPCKDERFDATYERLAEGEAT